MRAALSRRSGLSSIRWSLSVFQEVRGLLACGEMKSRCWRRFPPIKTPHEQILRGQAPLMPLRLPGTRNASQMRSFRSHPLQIQE